MAENTGARHSGCWVLGAGLAAQNTGARHSGRWVLGDADVEFEACEVAVDAALDIRR